MTERMTKGERDDLLRLVRQRERVCKTAAEQRSAALLAEFEQQISAVYKFDDNDTWAKAYGAAQEAFDAANAMIVAKSKELGIPEEFAPQLYMQWLRRGENEINSRRVELRRAAKAEIAASEKTAKAEIEAQSVKAQTEIMSHGLVSDSAKAFLESLAPIEKIMPPVSFTAVETKMLEKRKRQDWVQ